MRDSKASEVLRLNKAQNELVKTHNAQTMKLKLEFSMKEAIYKNKIKKLEEAKEKAVEELKQQFDAEKKALNAKLEEMGCEHSKKL